MQPHHDRLLLIDSLRGVAAMWVLTYHFYNALLPESNAVLFWWPFDQLFQAGYLGVFIFFVLSGFVINDSLQSREMSGGFFMRFLVRRLVRLDIPYWVVIILTGVSVEAMARFGLSQKEPVLLSDYFWNMAYLDNLLSKPSIVSVGWTLQYEVQFYLVLALLLLVFHYSGAGNHLRAGLLLLSCFFSVVFGFPGFPFFVKHLFVDYWFCFVLGIFVNDVIRSRVYSIYFWLAVAAAGVHGIVLNNPVGITSALTAILLFFAHRFNAFSTWLNWRPLLFLGSISYSLYLLHPFFGNRLLRFINYRYDLSVWSAAAIFIATTVVTVALVWVFYRLIESPSHQLSRRIKLSK